MPWLEIIWTTANEKHIGEHGIQRHEVEEVLADPDHVDVSRSTGRPIYFGYTRSGRYLAVVVEAVDEISVYPITAYEV